jgi:hypothetical protein
MTTAVASDNPRRVQRANTAAGAYAKARLKKCDTFMELSHHISGCVKVASVHGHVKQFRVWLKAYLTALLTCDPEKVDEFTAHGTRTHIPMAVLVESLPHITKRVFRLTLQILMWTGTCSAVTAICNMRMCVQVCLSSFLSWRNEETPGYDERVCVCRGMLHADVSV